MKKTTFFKTLFCTALMTFFSFNAFAQSPLLVEDFDYATGALLTDNGWTAHSGAGTEAIDVTTGLTFDGYLGSGVGGAANLDNNGEDVNRSFTAQSAGAIYISFLVQTDASNVEGYFFNLGPSPIGTAFSSRLFTNSTGSGLGISTNNTVPEFIPITAGKPVLVVIKHDFTANTTGLFIMQTFSASEPANADQTIAETTASIGSIALRQFNAAQRIIVDGIRVGTTWEDAVTPSGTVTLQVQTPVFDQPEGTYDAPVNVAITCDTEGAIIYYTTDESDPTTGSDVYAAPIAVTTTTQIRAKAFKEGMTPSETTSAIYTIATAGLNKAAIENVSVVNGTIHFSAKAGEQVEIYNAAGQQLGSYVTVEGSNALAVQTRGLVIMKVGGGMFKVMM